MRYVARNEYACTLEDVLARRLRLGFLDTLAALELADRVAAVLSEELQWSPEHKQEELRLFRQVD